MCSKRVNQRRNNRYQKSTKKEYNRIEQYLEGVVNCSKHNIRSRVMKEDGERERERERETEGVRED